MIILCFIEITDFCEQIENWTWLSDTREYIWSKLTFAMTPEKKMKIEHAHLTQEHIFH
jgi:hypothetical protein